MDYKKFGVTTVYQLVNEGIGDVGMNSVAAKRPNIFGIDTYTLGNIVGGLVVGLALPKVIKDTNAQVACEIIGAGLVAKGLVKLAKTYLVPATGIQSVTGIVRATPVQSVAPILSPAMGPSMF